MSMLKEQYKLLLGSRETLLDYCAAIKPQDLHKEIKEFNNSTISSMLLHITNTYLFWLIRFAGKKEFEYFDRSNVENFGDLRRAFKLSDEVMLNFIEEHPDVSGKIEGEIFWLKTNMSFTVLELFTHLITHEFHHKGQIMTMSRLLGYTPVDADIIRFN